MEEFIAVSQTRHLLGFQGGPLSSEVLSGTYKIIDGYPRTLNSVTASKRERKEKKFTANHGNSLKGKMGALTLHSCSLPSI